MLDNREQPLFRLNWALLAWTLSCLLFGLAILLPYQAGEWQGFYKQMLSVFGLVFWVLAVRPKKWHGFSLFMLLLMLVVVIQYLTGIINFFDDAFLSIAYLFMLLLSFEVGVALRESDDKYALDQAKSAGFFRMFWWTVLVVSLLSALIAFHQWLGTVNPMFEFPLIKGRPYANLAQPNHLASFLILGVCAVLFLYQRKAFAGWAGALVVCFLLVAVALTVSRLAWLFSLVALFYLLWKIKRDELSLSVWVPWFFVAFFVASIFATEYLTKQAGLSQLSAVGRVGEMNRLRLWGGLFGAVISGPWYGYGWMQVTTAALVSAAPEYGEYFNFSHNLLLDLLVWMGPWLGTLAIIASAIWVLNRYLRSVLNSEAVCWLAFGALLLHSLVEFPFAYVYFLTPAGLILGWAVGKSKQWTFFLPGGWGRVPSFLLATVLFVGAALVTREYGLLVKSRFNDEMRLAHITAFR